ncbi:MAG: type II secretion system F family protein [Candidatus Micrarchaeia archaeon]|jgi:flagellar protein FlaJ
MFEEELKRLGVKLEFKQLLAATSAASAAAAAIEAAVFGTTTSTQLLLVFITLSFPPVLLYFFLEYAREKRRQEIEEALPSALFQIASFPSKTGIEKIIASVAKSDYGALSEEFARAKRLLDAGASVPEALESMSKRCNSRLVSRACALLSQSYKSGANLSQPLKEVAEDVFDLQAIARENASALSMQKYTLMAGAVLVPLILGLLLNIVSSLDLGVSEFSAQSNAARQALLQAAVFGAQAYLVAFAAIASAFIAFQEGTPKKAVLYFTAFFPVSLLAFALVQSVKVI